MIYILSSIGGGKSSLTKILSDTLDSNAYYERVDDMPMLKEYYSAGDASRKQLSFQLQIAFLNYRYTQLRHAIVEHNAVMDSSLLSDNIMASAIHKRGEMTDTAFDLYQNLSMNMNANVNGHEFHGFPDLIVYLDISVDQEIDQIQQRGRDMEDIRKDPELVDYYHSINQAYKDWYDGYVQSPVLKIDMSETDFVNSLEDRTRVLTKIESRLIELGMLNKTEQINFEHKVFEMNHPQEHIIQMGKLEQTILDI